MPAKVSSCALVHRCTDLLTLYAGVSYQGGHKVSTDAKALLFERGKAKIEVKYLDGQLIGFTIESSPVPEGPLTISASELYGSLYCLHFIDYVRICLVDSRNI